MEINEYLYLINKLADILEAINQFDKIVSVVEKLEITNSLRHLNPKIYTKIADLYNQKPNLNNRQQAIKFYLKSLDSSSEKNSDSLLIRLKLSEIYKSLNEFNKALQILNEENMLNNNIDCHNSSTLNVKTQLMNKIQSGSNVKEEEIHTLKHKGTIKSFSETEKDNFSMYNLEEEPNDFNTEYFQTSNLII